MSKIANLKQQKAALIEEIQNYTTSEDFSQKGYDILDRDLAKLTSQIDTAEKALNLSASTARPSTASQDTTKFKNLGENLAAIVKASRGGGVDPRLIKAPTGMGETDPQYGGYTLQDELAHDIITRIYDSSIIASKVMRRNIGPFSNGLRLPVVNETSRATGSRFGGVEVYWEDEGTTPTATKPALKMLNLNLKKMIGLWYITDELMEDNVAFSSFAQDAFALELRWMIENAIVQGTGVGQPLGFLNGGGLVTQAAEKGQAAGTIVYQNITNMYSKMFAPSMKNAVWLVHQSTLPQLMSLSMPIGTAGYPMWQPANFAAGAPQDMLLGKPVHVVEQVPALGTAGCVSLVDLDAYVMIEKAGPQFAQSIHVEFKTDQNVFRVTYRVDGAPLFSATITSAYGNVSMSSYVALGAI